MNARAVRLGLMTVVCVGAVGLPQTAAAQSTVVVGTGNPDVDIPAVQAAVSQGGDVTLQGRFSFDRPPTIQTALVPATILVSTTTAISGDSDTSIEGGTIPFYVNAAGAVVTIRNLHFVRPTNSAILVSAVSGLTILSCEIEGIMPLPNKPSSGVWISTTGSAIPNPGQVDHARNISGRVVIANNDIDAAGGTAADNTLGITFFSVGEPDQQVDIYVSGNAIRNVTEPAINFRRIAGRAHIEQNVITTGTLVGTTPRPEAIRVANTGSYVIARNRIDCQWPDASAIGIGLFSQFSAWPIQSAAIVDNEVTMSPPDDPTFVDFSAGIDVRGFAGYNVVASNTVRGRARAAVAVDVFNGGTPDNTAFLLNRLQEFNASVADVLVGAGVTNTLVVGGTGTVAYDGSINTVILPFRPKPGADE